MVSWFNCNNSSKFSDNAFFGADELHTEQTATLMWTNNIRPTQKGSIQTSSGLPEIAFKLTTTTTKNCVFRDTLQASVSVWYCLEKHAASMVILNFLHVAPLAKWSVYQQQHTEFSKPWTLLTGMYAWLILCGLCAFAMEPVSTMTHTAPGRWDNVHLIFEDLASTSPF